jgi:outer membrane immunogenic protein
MRRNISPQMSRISPLLLVLIFCTALIDRDAPAQSTLVDWSGLYVGGDLGGSWRSYEFGDSPEVFAFSGRTVLFPGFTEGSGSSFLAGGRIGYDQQIGMIVVGLEGGADWVSSKRVSKTQQKLVPESFFPPPMDVVTSNHSAAESDLIKVIDARVGFAWQRFLFYADGGVAFTDITVRANDSFIVPGCCGELGVGGDSKAVGGWTGGGGVEWLITSAVSVAIDYRHLDFGSDTYNPTRDRFEFSAPTRIGLTEDQVALRINLQLKAFFGQWTRRW